MGTYIRTKSVNGQHTLAVQSFPIQRIISNKHNRAVILNYAIISARQTYDCMHIVHPNAPKRRNI